MERLNRTLARCGLALLLAAPGCKSAQSNVPPGRPYSSDGRQAAPISFSSDPHQMQANANPGLGAPTMTAGGMPTSPGGLPPQFGTPSPNAAGAYGAPTSGAYGPPGSSTLGGGAASGVGSPSLSPSSTGLGGAAGVPGSMP